MDTNEHTGRETEIHIKKRRTIRIFEGCEGNAIFNKNALRYKNCYYAIHLYFLFTLSNCMYCHV